MHGIQHLFRQHALEKQGSTESWHSAQGTINSQASLQQNDYQNQAENLEINDNSYPQGKYQPFHLSFQRLLD